MKKTTIIFGLVFLIMLNLVLATANVVEVSHQVTTSDEKIFVSVTLKNVGIETAPPFLYEIQVAQQPLLSTVGVQTFCNPSTPQNTHKTVTSLDAGESVMISLSSPDTGTLPSGTYHVYGVSYDSCCLANPNCQPVQPYLSTYGIKLLDTVTVNGGSSMYTLIILVVASIGLYLMKRKK